MANEFRKVTDQNGVYHPVTDDTRMTWSANGVLGAKNLLPFKYASKTENGATIVANSDGTLTISTDGATTGVTNIFEIFDLPAGTYILNGCNGGSEQTYLMDVYENMWTNRQIAPDGDKTIVFTTNTNHVWRMVINEGTNIPTPITVRPMIRLASDTDTTYAPYAMTNMELTEKVQGIINAATNAADFAAFKTAIGNL